MLSCTSATRDRNKFKENQQLIRNDEHPIALLLTDTQEVEMVPRTFVMTGLFQHIPALLINIYVHVDLVPETRGVSWRMYMQNMVSSTSTHTENMLSPLPASHGVKA